MSNLLAEHLKKYPDCTRETCPHQKHYLAKVIFKQPDNGFIGTVTAFNDEQAEQVLRDGVAKTHPNLDIKSVELDGEILKDPKILKLYGLA